MADATLTEARFQSEEAARKYLESIRWPSGPVCPHCGGTERQSHLNGKAHRPGVIFCGECREQYTVTVGTVFERSKVPLHKWLAATHLLCASKKGMSSKQIERTLGVTYKTAWFMTHRIREAMRPASMTPMGQGGGGVEIDETYIGRDKSKPKSKKKLVPILRANVAREAHVITDSNRSYNILDMTFRRHDAVNHSTGEYVSFTNPEIHTNTIEGFFSIFKRGMKGIYQHCGKQHLHRYLAEFDFRYSQRERLGVDDSKRADKALRGISGKRLTYRRIGV